MGTHYEKCRKETESRMSRYDEKEVGSKFVGTRKDAYSGGYETVLKDTIVTRTTCCFHCSVCGFLKEKRDRLS